MRRRELLALGAGLLAGTVLAKAGRAETWPGRPVTLMVPFGAGGATDIVTRALAAAMGKRIDQPIVVDNRPGGNGTVALSTRLKFAAPDGHTLSTITTGAIRLPLMQPMNFDGIQDFTWISMVSALRHFIVVRPDARWQDWPALLAEARASPGRIRFGSPGQYSLMHVELIRVGQEKGVTWENVPFRGDVEAVTTLLSGDLDFAVTSTAIGELAKRGEVRLLGLMSADRLPGYPEVPTLIEQGTASVCEVPYGVAGPAGMAPALTERIAAVIRAAMDDPDHLALLDRMNQRPAYLGPAEATAWARRFRDEQAALLQRLNIPRQG
ncbi:tripartite tricarboxylate transporter substrate binding protein [Siccirubricoccus phaeus]|uniref:tripartite tricarboxylate transporter substrate binding protein n=1 Tax=Siccirubricoccus phaeus TaxID=2595053 RepID=UPI00165B1012|nr:tripartite tricarboxylate transporter substrate binding protein [Siccirubricoccus phaeus]